MVNLTVDDKQVTVPRDFTIFDAAKSVGIRIPILCHDKKLHPFGGCRNLPDHDVGGGACNRSEVVVLGHPIAGVAEAIGETRKIERVPQRCGTG